MFQWITKAIPKAVGCQAMQLQVTAHADSNINIAPGDIQSRGPAPSTLPYPALQVESTSSEYIALS